MKRLTIVFIWVCVLSLTTTAQDGNIGIGTLEPKASAILDLEATNKGLLIPRVTLTDAHAAGPITQPLERGLLVFNVGGNFPEGFYYWSGEEWLLLASKSLLPKVVTHAVTGIGIQTATGGGEVVEAGEPPATTRGVCWSTSSNPTISNSHTSDGGGAGTFTSSLTGLASNTTYYVRAYATNAIGTSYGEQVSFATLGDPCETKTIMACDVTYSGSLGPTGVWGSPDDGGTYNGSTWPEPGEEKVYEFTAPRSGTYTFHANYSGGDADFFLMSTCGTSGTNVIGDNWSIGDKSVALTENFTYYLIVDNYNLNPVESYTVSVTCPSTPCDAPEDMQCGVTYSGTLATTGSFWDTHLTSTLNYPGSEIVYKFVAPTTGSYTFNSSRINGDIDWWLMTTCSNVGTNMFGSSYWPGDGPSTAVTLTAGTTYYLIGDLYQSATEPTQYTVSVTCPGGSTPSGESCETAIPMTCGTVYEGTLAATGSEDWKKYTDAAPTYPGGEKFYKFTPTSNGDYTITLTENTGDPDAILMSDCNNDSNSTNYFKNITPNGYLSSSPSGDGNTATLTVALNANTTYYLFVDSWYSSGSPRTASYKISVTCPN